MLFIAANSSPAPKGSHLLIETEDDNEADFKKEVNITVMASRNKIRTTSFIPTVGSARHVFLVGLGFVCLVVKEMGRF